MAALLLAVAALVTRRLLSPAHHKRLDPPTPARRNILIDLQSDGSVTSVSERIDNNNNNKSSSSSSSSNNNGNKDDDTGTNGMNDDGDGGDAGDGGRDADSSRVANVPPFDPESLDEEKET